MTSTMICYEAEKDFSKPYIKTLLTVLEEK